MSIVLNGNSEDIFIEIFEDHMGWVTIDTPIFYSLRNAIMSIFGDKEIYYIVDNWKLYEILDIVDSYEMPDIMNMALKVRFVRDIDPSEIQYGTPIEMYEGPGLMYMIRSLVMFPEYNNDIGYYIQELYDYNYETNQAGKVSDYDEYGTARAKDDKTRLDINLKFLRGY